MSFLERKQSAMRSPWIDINWKLLDKSETVKAIDAVENKDFEALDKLKFKRQKIVDEKCSH